MDKRQIKISTQSGGSLVGVVLNNPEFPGKKPAILVVHGWTSEMARYPERVAPEIDMGYLAVLFDMRGHGKTGGRLGELSPKDHLDDCLAAYDYMIGLPNADSSNISVFGSSYGGYLASLLTAQRKVHHLALNAPALYPDVIFDMPKLQRSQKATNYRKQLHNPKEDKALSAISNFKGDLLLIQAEKDEVLPKEVMKSYCNAAKNGYDLELIRGADHSMKVPGTNEARIKILAKWFTKFV
jgi:pimeloyl-ACP methyl ester carboxylesterase